MIKFGSAIFDSFIFISYNKSQVLSNKIEKKEGGKRMQQNGAVKRERNDSELYEFIYHHQKDMKIQTEREK